MEKTPIEEIIARFPKNRPELPEEYKAIYGRHFNENRKGLTKASSKSSALEGWMHRQIAKTSTAGKTLEIGAGSLNQFQYEEKKGVFDAIEPYHAIYEGSPYVRNVDRFYDDISQIPDGQSYDRIISVAVFEHILNLPSVIRKAGRLLAEGGVLAAAIPNEGRFLWKFAYRNTTGREFRKRYGLDYEVLMRHEHVNTADEIETLLRYYFADVEEKLFGISKDLAFYRCFCCRNPVPSRCAG